MFGRTVCNCMVTFLLESCKKSGCLRSRRNPAEGVVVIGGVEARLRSLGLATAAYDPARAPVACPRARDRVFAVIAAWSKRQDALAIAEHRPVLRVCKRTPHVDPPVHELRLDRQLADTDRRRRRR